MSRADATEPSRTGDVEQIRLRGAVQGAGVRPTVARLARKRGLWGWVKNDAEGVLILLCGPLALRDAFLRDLSMEMPPLARVVSVERASLSAHHGVREGFSIARSDASPCGAHPAAAILPDAATCDLCLAETRDPAARRYRYPFTNCTHCGPRFTIVAQIPYDRARTTMAGFELCEACSSEYGNDGDRRYHAEPIACSQCGPRVRLWPSPESERNAHVDELEIATILLKRGEILAIKGIGGYHLCCDATNEETVSALRVKKHRPSKAFALMARDIDMVMRYCCVSPIQRDALASVRAPIVLLDRVREAVSPGGALGHQKPIAESVAPGRTTLGMMLPFSPLHHLLMDRMESPIVCTSGNLSEEPPCISAEEARSRLSNVATYFLDHDRPIAHRIDDSVARVAGGDLRVIRRARGYAPDPLSLPSGFENTRSVVAMGGQWKNTLCFLARGQATLSQHLGDLDSALAFSEWRAARASLGALFEHRPEVVAVDCHPEYACTQDGLVWARELSLPVVTVHHHHAHVAACLAEHGVPASTKRVLGITLDGLGYGEGGSLWGGEFLLADYTSFERLGTFKPTRLLGGDLAAKEPWRNLYAHLLSEMTWAELLAAYGGLPSIRLLADKPRAMLDHAMKMGNFAPLASSCGRLFDAASAAVGLFSDKIDYEGQAAIALEQAVSQEALHEAKARSGYPFEIRALGPNELPAIDAFPCFRGLLDDLARGASVPIVAARFHVGLAEVIVEMTERIQKRASFDTIALSGGVWQNGVLLELVAPSLRERGYRVLVPSAYPVNDGGISLGQAVIASLSTL